MVSTVLAMTVDYGTNTFTGPVTVHSHPGDTEVFFTVWRVGADQLRFHGLHSKAHEGDFLGRGSTYLPANTKHLTFTAGEHRLRHLPRGGQARVWPIWQLCNNLSPYDCRGEKAVLQTRAVNVGEPPAGPSIHPNSRPGRPHINVSDVNGEDDSPFMHVPRSCTGLTTKGVVRQSTPSETRLRRRAASCGPGITSGFESSPKQKPPIVVEPTSTNPLGSVDAPSWSAACQPDAMRRHEPRPGSGGGKKGRLPCTKRMAAPHFVKTVASQPEDVRHPDPNHPNGRRRSSGMEISRRRTPSTFCELLAPPEHRPGRTWDRSRCGAQGGMTQG